MGKEATPSLEITHPEITLPSGHNSQDPVFMQMSSVIKKVEIEKHKIDDIGAKVCLNRLELGFSIRCQ